VASTSSTVVPMLTGGEWRPLSFNVSSSSSTLESGILAGDFRSLPRPQWNGILFAKFASSPSQVDAFCALALDLEKQFSMRAVNVRDPSPSVSEAIDKCSKLIKIGLLECHKVSPDFFPHFREGFLTVFGNFLDEFVNAVTINNANILYRAAVGA
jgi:hypothetical protein